MNKRRVGVLMGGTSGEREISLKTGEGVARALEARGHEVARVVFGSEPIDLTLRAAAIDVAFLALHGRGGEDGCLQGMLELMGIPYTGSSVLASALAMDKLKAKEMFRLHNIPTPPYYVATENDLLGDDDLAELRSGIESALETDRWALVERYIKATEVHVGVLDGRVLGCIEVAPKSGIYDYAAKYTAGATDYIIPPRIAPTRARGVMNLAERAVRALGCTGAVRVDLLVTEGENEYVLEVNTLPGMTATSLLPKIADHAGIAYGELCELILAGATLHSGLQAKPASERRRSGVTFAPHAESAVTPVAAARKAV